jgi:hypothetical protein
MSEHGIVLKAGRVTRSGPPFDPACRLCYRGWVDFTDDQGHDWTRRCPDCETKAEAMQVPAQRRDGK